MIRGQEDSFEDRTKGGLGTMKGTEFRHDSGHVHTDVVIVEQTSPA